MANKSILSEAEDIVNGARKDTYDHPFDNFTRVARIWSAILGVEITAEQVALCMVGMKISRESFSHSRDNLVDGAGYFYTLELVREEAARRAG